MAGLLVVDVDYIAFMAASTQEIHTIRAVSLDEKLEYKAKHRTAFKGMVIEDGYKHSDFTIHEVQDLKKDALKNAKIIMKRCIESYMRLTDCDKVKIVIRRFV